MIANMDFSGKWISHCCIIAMLFLTVLELRSEEPTQGVDMLLLPSVKTVAPSSTFTVGLRIHHHPGFHTYWKNPGVVGYPIQIKWELPEGFVASDVLWPVPEMSSMAGHPVFGYTSDVMLLIDIMAPENLPEGEIVLHADVAWMACSDACYPDNRRFSVTIPSGETKLYDEEFEEQFTHAGRRIPQRLREWQSEVRTQADADMIEVELTPPDGEHVPLDLSFFSEDRQVSSDPAPTIERSEDGKIYIKVKRSEFSPKEKKYLPFVLVGDGGKWFGRLNPEYPEG